MYYRLREAAGIRDGVSIADWFNTAGPSADESVAEFMVLYQRVHGAGVSRGQLAQLADLYHRALRHLDTYRKVTDSLAGTAAQIVGATVATIVVTVFSGGALGPVAVAAMASVSAAAGSAAAGAALRVHNTMSSVLKDAGTGAVEGIATAAGASLAARMVRGAAMGLPAGRAAASVGARAVGQASHAGTEIAAAVIDSALGGAAGELFQTATDEATWDRGVAEAFATMLAAIARGARSGAAIGGAVGGAVQVAGKLVRLIARVGRPAAEDFTRVAESVGVGAKTLEHLSERDQEQIARALDLARAGQVAEAERLLASVDGLSGQAGAIARNHAAGNASKTAAMREQPGGASRDPRVVEPYPENPFRHVEQKEDNWCGAACGEMAARRLGVEVDQSALAATAHFEPQVKIDGEVVRAGGFQTAGLADALRDVAHTPGRRWIGGTIPHDLSTPLELRTHLQGYLSATKTSIILRVSGGKHWIIIDEVLPNGRIAIRDPGEGTSTLVTAQQLSAMRPTGDAVLSFPEAR